MLAINFNFGSCLWGIVHTNTGKALTDRKFPIMQSETILKDRCKKGDITA